MATREFLNYFREARNGDASAQLELGRNFLRGGKGLAPNVAGALIWLSKAAKQGLSEATQLIGEHIPLKVAIQYPDPEFILSCYREVGSTGNTVARWQYVQWILRYTYPSKSQADIDLALIWLQNLADARFPAACWELAQIFHQDKYFSMDLTKATHYAQLAAQGGDRHAIRWLSRQALIRQDRDSLLTHAAPLIPELLEKNNIPLEDAQLLYEYAHNNLKNFATITTHEKKIRPLHNPSKI